MASAALPCRVRRGRTFPLRCAMLLAIAFTVEAKKAKYDTIDGHRCFRNLKGMTESMFDLARAYPDLSTIADIGDSYLKSNDKNNEDYPLPQNGYDIYAMKITASDSPIKSSAKGKTLIISGVHPREYAPPELTMRLAESLLGGYGADADVTWILRHTEVHIIFHVNPDSRYVTETYPRTYWRKNQNPDRGCDAEDIGVDLNRNYDFMWGDQDGASDDECDSTYHGKKAESEPETQAVVNYAKSLFPKGQRRDRPEDTLKKGFGEDIMGIFVDVHSSGGYIFYPWGHKDSKSKDDDALQATARKMSYFNGYTLWAGGQPDFRYAASGDSSDYMYAALGVASFGFELGEEKYEDCDLFEDEIVPDNLSALTYLVKNAKKPFSLAKGPDIMRLDIRDGTQNGIKVTVVASDSRMVNSLRGYPDFPETGDQGVAEVRAYLDVHPDDFQKGDMAWEMQLVNDDDEEPTFELEIALPRGVSAGRHTLFVQAKDGDDYFGPATGAFFDVERRTTEDPSISPTPAPTATPSKKPSKKPSRKPSRKPSKKPSKKPSMSPTTAKPSASPTGKPTVAPTLTPTTSKPSASPTANPTISPTTAPTLTPSTNPSKMPTDQPTNIPSDSPSTSNPTSQPSTTPSTGPSTNPSKDPSSLPSDVPTLQPSKAPTIQPTSSLTVAQNINPQPRPSASTTADSSPSRGIHSAALTSSSKNSSSSACWSVALAALVVPAFLLL